MSPTHHHSTLTFALVAAVALSWTSTPARALQACDKDADCTTATDACHAGRCIPKAKLCTSTSACASHQVCDMTCPHGTSTATSTDAPTTEPASSGEEPKEAKPNDGKDAGQPDSEKGAAALPGETSTSKPVCPKTIGVCVVAPKKVKADTQCKAFCAIATKCESDTLNGGSAVGKTTTPEPGTDGGSSSGSSGSSGSGSSGSSDDKPTDPDGDDAVPPKKSDEGGADEPAPSGAKPNGNTQGMPAKPDTSACEFMCSVLKLEKIAEPAFQAAVKCTIAAASKTCSEIEKDCKTETDAVEKAFKDEETKLELAFAGGFGSDDIALDSKSSGTTNEGNNGRLNNEGGESTPGGDTNQALGADAAGGCTAGLVSGSQGASGAALALFALMALAWRRRLA